jgi:hypothetical protein
MTMKIVTTVENEIQKSCYASTDALVCNLGQGKAAYICKTSSGLIDAAFTNEPSHEPSPAEEEINISNLIVNHNCSLETVQKSHDKRQKINA